MAEIKVFSDAAALAEGAADLIAEALTTTPDLALSGGSTPEATYRRLSERDIDWGRVDLWLGDERWVPHDDADSNYPMARRAFGANAHRILPTPWVSGVGPAAAAGAYQQLLQARIPDGDRIGPGVVLLGLGDDTHTASLFPGSSALFETDRDYVATFVDAKGVWRLTLTLPAIHRAALVVFLVSGAGKAAALADVVSPDSSAPAALAARGAGRVIWMVDEEAASGLPTR